MVGQRVRGGRCFRDQIICPAFRAQGEPEGLILRERVRSTDGEKIRPPARSEAGGVCDHVGACFFLVLSHWQVAIPVIPAIPTASGCHWGAGSSTEVQRQVNAKRRLYEEVGEKMRAGSEKARTLLRARSVTLIPILLGCRRSDGSAVFVGRELGPWRP